MKSFAPLDFPRARLVPGHRYATPGGMEYPSVTTILNGTKSAGDVAGLEEWRARVGVDVADYIMNEAAVIGTQTHRLNEDYLNGRPSGETRLLARAHHCNFRPYLDRMGTIYGTELPLYSDIMRVAGTADCVAEYGGRTCMIDYKTKRVPQRPEWLGDYHIQTAAYSMMLRELTGIRVERCIILVSSERDTMQEFVSDPQAYAGKFLLRLAEYGRDN